MIASALRQRPGHPQLPDIFPTAQKGMEAGPVSEVETHSALGPAPGACGAFHRRGPGWVLARESLPGTGPYISGQEVWPQSQEGNGVNCVAFPAPVFQKVTGFLFTCFSSTLLRCNLRPVNRMGR